MKILRLNKKQKDFLADKLMDPANYALGILGIGQLLGKEIKLLELIFGIVLYLWLLSIALLLKKG